MKSVHRASRDYYELLPCFARSKGKILERQSSKAIKAGSGRARLAGGSDLREICGLREQIKSIGLGSDDHARRRIDEEIAS